VVFDLKFLPRPCHPGDRNFKVTTLPGLSIAPRADDLAAAGRTRLAAHLAGLASCAAPEDRQVQAIRAAVLHGCVDSEPSLMGKALLSVYRRDAEKRSRS
jgi:hypothetical protein